MTGSNQPLESGGPEDFRHDLNPEDLAGFTVASVGPYPAQDAAIYIDLSDEECREFTAAAGMRVGRESPFVPTSDVDYQFWNRLIGVEYMERPEQSVDSVTSERDARDERQIDVPRLTTRDDVVHQVQEASRKVSNERRRDRGAGAVRRPPRDDPRFSDPSVPPEQPDVPAGGTSGGEMQGRPPG